MNVSQNVDGRHQLKKNRLLLKYTLCRLDEQTNFFLLENIGQIGGTAPLRLIYGIACVLVMIFEPIDNVIEQLCGHAAFFHLYDLFFVLH
jgi:hypothetical protein